MRLHRAAWIAAGALALSLAAAPVSFAAPTAPSSVMRFSGSNCPSNSLCLYRDYGFTGGGIALQRGDMIRRLSDYGFNDQMSSWSNDSGGTCAWYTHDNGQGDEHLLHNRYRVNVLSSENDSASSVICPS